MKIRRKALFCLVLLLAAGALLMRSSQLFFTPRSAFEDACLGANGRVLPVVGEYDAGNARFYLCRDGERAEVLMVERTLGLFWTPSHPDILPSDPRNPEHLIYPILSFSDEHPYVCVLVADPDVAIVYLRLDREDGPSNALSSSPPYGDLYFWYLPDYFTGQDVKEALKNCDFVFLACGADGTVLYEDSY